MLDARRAHLVDVDNHVVLVAKHGEVLCEGHRAGGLIRSHGLVNQVEAETVRGHMYLVLVRLGLDDGVVSVAVVVAEGQLVPRLDVFSLRVLRRHREGQRACRAFQIIYKLVIIEVQGIRQRVVQVAYSVVVG